MTGWEAIIDSLKKLIIANIRANCGGVGRVEPYYISTSGRLGFDGWELYCNL